MRCASRPPRRWPRAAPDGGMDPECILPTMIEWEVYAREAVAVGMKAQEQGIARVDAVCG